MNPKSDIRGLINQLHRNADLLEDAYFSGAISQTDENLAALRSLHDARIMAPHRNGQYRLTRRIREFFDEHTQRQQRFAIGGNLTDEVERMEQLLASLEEAANAGRINELDLALDDLEMSLFDIREMIEQELLQFEQVMHTRFSNVKSNEEKRRQNDYYLKRADRLKSVLEELNRESLHERFSNRTLGGAGLTYNLAIVQQISKWSAAQLAISRVFTEYMFKFRHIAEATARMRAFRQYLKTHGTARLEEALEAPSARMLRVTGDSSPLMLNLADEGARERLAIVASSLKAIKPKDVTMRAVGARRKEAMPEEVEDDTSVEQQALSVFLSVVDSHDDFLSARQWAEGQESVDVPRFLEHLLSWTTMETSDEYEENLITDDLAFAAAANVTIGDIELCRIV